MLNINPATIMTLHSLLIKTPDRGYSVRSFHGFYGRMYIVLWMDSVGCCLVKETQNIDVSQYYEIFQEALKAYMAHKTQ